MDFGSALKAVLLDRAECTDKGQQIAQHNALSTQDRVHTWGRILVRGRPLSKEPSNALAAPGSARCGLLPTSKTWIVSYVCVEYICAGPCQNRLLDMFADMCWLL